MKVREAMIIAARRKGCSEKEILRITGEVSAEYPEGEDSAALGVSDEEAIRFCEELIDRAKAAVLAEWDRQSRNKANN